MKKPKIITFYVSAIFFALSAFASTLIFMSFKTYDKVSYDNIIGTVKNMEYNYSQYKGWIIQLEESNDVYRIIPISSDIIKATEIQNRLPSGTKVTITIMPYKNSVYNIMGIESENVIILDIDEMIARLQKNDFDALIGGILLVSISSAIGLAFLIMSIVRYKTRILSNYGDKKIYAQYMGNIIEVYNATKVLTLVINNNVADKYESFFAAKVKLNGKIETSDGEKNIYLKLNAWGTLRLYCEEKLLAKKLMPFG